MAVLLSRLDHYSHISDVQTLAMLCSVFRAQAPPPDGYSHGHRSSVIPPPHSRYVSASVAKLAIWSLAGCCVGGATIGSDVIVLVVSAQLHVQLGHLRLVLQHLGLYHHDDVEHR